MYALLLGHTHTYVIYAQIVILMSLTHWVKFQTKILCLNLTPMCNISFLKGRANKTYKCKQKIK